ncbi:MAG: ribonuclease R, partial [Anaeroplasmataceae bacterium]|nr:ribonuclease R [Anaeroplasmataceae bacterium]
PRATHCYSSAASYVYNRQAIIHVVKRGHEHIIGTFVRRMRKGKMKSYIHSSNPSFSVKAIVKREYPELEDGQIVYGHLSYVGTAIEAEILEVIGHKDDPGIEIAQIALEYGFQTEFPMKVLEEIHFIPDYVLEEEKKDRKDFRNRLIFTIDGDDSKDFDDAVDICKNLDGSYELGVYIADVSHYVKPNTPLDKEALKRGTSVYLADRVIPMLPHKLSNGICSLNEHEDRLVLACLMTFSKEGKLLNYTICEGLICSKYRMTYKKVNEILHGNSDLMKQYSDLIEPIHQMQELSNILRKIRTKKGALQFDIPEYKFVLDNQGEPVDVYPIERDQAEMMIEDFMLAANETVAYHLNIMGIPAIYRVHEKPDQEKLGEAISKLQSLGLSVHHKSKRISSMDLQKFLDSLE